jgi:hypothetical protein
MGELIWGVPAQRKTKTEKFNTPVATMHDLAKKGSGRKISFNKAAQELLGIIPGESHVSFGFDPDNGDTYIQCSQTETPNSFAVSKTSASISNKRTYEYIAKSKDLNTDVENYLHLDTVDGQPYVVVFNITVDGEAEMPTKELETVRAMDDVEEEEVAEMPQPVEEVEEMEASDDNDPAW